MKTHRGPNLSHKGPQMNRMRRLFIVSKWDCGQIQNEHLRGQECYNVRICYIGLGHVEIFLNGGSQLDTVSVQFRREDIRIVRSTHQRWKSEPRQERDKETEPREEEYSAISIDRVENWN